MAERPTRYFTVEEANRRLPLVRAIVQDIVTLFHDVHERRERLTRIRQLRGRKVPERVSLYDEELQQIEEGIDADIARIEGYLAELQELGVELKDYVTGLVDFRSRLEGRDVWLCWKLGEDEVAYWHELDAGFQGRHPLYEASMTGESPPGGDAAE